MSDSMITLENVSLRYATPSEVVVALEGVTVSVQSGSFVALVGTSGSGKTSLINVVSGLRPADSGAVQVAGHDVDSMSEAERASMRLADVGVVFQDHNLIPEFSAEENVLLPVRGRGVSRAEASAQADEWLTKVGLGELGRRMPSQLSGGQRQRVGIARALVGGRKVLLADEPTGSLDAENSAAIFELLSTLATSGVTVVVATHDPIVREYADRVLTMSDGRIIADEAIGKAA